MTRSVVEDDIEEVVAGDLAWERLAGARVLVTGATGMTGLYVTRALLALSRRLGTAPRVVGLVQNRSKAERLYAEALAAGALELAVQDVAEPFGVDGAVDWVIHTASPANPAAFRDDPVGVVRANVLGTLHGLELARSRGAAICLVSTMEVYGAVTSLPGHAEELVPEEAPGVLDSLDLRSAYPESKRLAETLCVAAHAQHGTDYRIARLSHTYGPGMGAEDARVPAYFLRQALAGEDIVLQSDGTLERTYTYVADAASAVLAMVLTEGSGTYNVANEDARVSVRELAETFQRHSPVPGGRVVTEPRTDTGLWSKAPSGTFLDCSRLRATGWRPRVSVDEGVARWLAHHSRR
jgi:UDP-glucuronate decarboxylase